MCCELTACEAELRIKRVQILCRTGCRVVWLTLKIRPITEEKLGFLALATAVRGDVVAVCGSLPAIWVTSVAFLCDKDAEIVRVSPLRCPARGADGYLLNAGSRLSSGLWGLFVSSRCCEMPVGTRWVPPAALRRLFFMPGSSLILLYWLRGFGATYHSFAPTCSLHPTSVTAAPSPGKTRSGRMAYHHPRSGGQSRREFAAPTYRPQSLS